MPATLRVSRVQKKGQVTIPIEIRDKLGLEEGDLVAFIETAQGVMLRAQALVPADKLEPSRQREEQQGALPAPFGFVERLRQDATLSTGVETLLAGPGVAEQTFGAFAAVEDAEDLRAWRQRFAEETAARIRAEMQDEA